MVPAEQLNQVNEGHGEFDVGSLPETLEILNNGSARSQHPH